MHAATFFAISSPFSQPSQNALASVSSVHVKSTPLSLSMVIRSLFSPSPTETMTGSSRTSSMYIITLILSAQFLIVCVMRFWTSANTSSNFWRFEKFALALEKALFRFVSVNLPEVWKNENHKFKKIIHTINWTYLFTVSVKLNTVNIEEFKLPFNSTFVIYFKTHFLRTTRKLFLSKNEENLNCILKIQLMFNFTVHSEISLSSIFTILCSNFLICFILIFFITNEKNPTKFNELYFILTYG